MIRLKQIVCFLGLLFPLVFLESCVNHGRKKFRRAHSLALETNPNVQALPPPESQQALGSSLPSLSSAPWAFPASNGELSLKLFSSGLAGWEGIEAPAYTLSHKNSIHYALQGQDLKIQVKLSCEEGKSKESLCGETEATKIDYVLTADPSIDFYPAMETIEKAFESRCQTEVPSPTQDSKADPNAAATVAEASTTVAEASSSPATLPLKINEFCSPNVVFQEGVLSKVFQVSPASINLDRSLSKPPQSLLLVLRTEKEGLHSYTWFKFSALYP
ncbi:MAG: hypothetical protein KA436_01840 [Oligoflexales bacterium]|nr:hypothetical protein [Oligoflexales bacterium]